MSCLEPIQIDRLVRSIVEENNYDMVKVKERDSLYLDHVQHCKECCNQTIDELSALGGTAIAPTIEVLMGC